MQSQVLEFIFAGESEVLELKTSVREPQVLSRLIGSFANAQGGKIVIGVKESPEVVGVDEALIRRVYEAALKRLVPQPKANLSFLEADGKSVAIVEVERSPEIILSEGSAFVRTGSMTQPMAWSQMRRQLPAQPSPSTIESLTKAIERQSKMIEEMHVQIREGNTWQARWKERGVGFGLGVLASVIASIGYARF